LKIPKLGLIKFVNSREIKGNIKNFTISKTNSGDFFATVQVELEILIKHL